MTDALRCTPLVPESWPDLEALFGDKGACGGCWCQHWRLPKGEAWAQVKGEVARGRLEEQVAAGEALGVLAYWGQRPVGYAALGPRTSFPKLDRAPSFACEDAAELWSLPCFFVSPKARGQGVGRALLEAAEAEIFRRGGRLVEAYPAKPQASGAKLPAAFAWTGPEALFVAAGYTLVGPPEAGKRRWRKSLG